MDKRLLLAGIVLIVAGAAIAIAYASQNFSVAATSARQTVSIAPNGIVYSQVTLNSSNLLYVAYKAGNNTPVDFYLVSSSAFSTLLPYIEKGSIPASVLAAYKGSGLYMEMENSTQGIFPYNASYSSQGFTTPSYYNNTAILGKGTYYMIYRNPGSIASNTTFGYVLPNGALVSTATEISTSGLGLYGAVSALLILAGLVVAVWSLLSGGKEQQEVSEEREEEVRKLYKRIGEKEKRKTRKASRRGRNI